MRRSNYRKRRGRDKAFTRLPEFRAEGSFEGWLRRIVVTTALNHWQSGQHRRQQLLLDDVPEPYAPDADALDRLTVAEVLALMEQLPDGCRLVLNLYAVDGYSHAEIAELLGIQQSTSKAQLSKARKHLTLLHQRQTSYLSSRAEVTVVCQTARHSALAGESRSRQQAARMNRARFPGKLGMTFFFVRLLVRDYLKL